MKQGLLNPKSVRAMVEEPSVAGRFASRVWNLVVLDVWLQVHQRPAAPRETLSELIGVAA